MHFRHWLFHIEQHHCEQSIHNFGMDNPNTFNCLIFTRNTLPLSSTLPLFICLPPFLPFSPPLCLPIFLSSVLPPSLFHSHPFHILPSLYFASLLPARSILSQSYTA